MNRPIAVLLWVMTLSLISCHSALPPSNKVKALVISEEAKALALKASNGDKVALTQITALANNGDVTMQVLLGLMLHSSAEKRHADAQDKEVVAGVNWLRKAADQGSTEAQFLLGGSYAEGIGVPKDSAAAVSWYRKAAEQGSAEAGYVLGDMYYNGTKGATKDFAAALSWFRKAAEQGNAQAKTNLGYMYTNGEGVPKDLVLAYMWFNLAAAQGHEFGKNNRDNLEEQMTPAQIAEAQKLSRDWKPKK